MRKEVYLFFLVVMTLFLTTATFAGDKWISLTGGTSPETPTIEILSSTETETVIKITPNGFWSEDVTADKEVYQQLSLPGYTGTAEIGKPEMPLITDLVAIPGYADVTPSVLDATTEVLKGYNVYPHQTPLLEDKTAGKFDLDAATYGADQDYPKDPVTIGEPGIWRDLRVIRLSVAPFAFNPVTGNLTVYTELIVKLSYTGSSTVNTKDLKNDPIGESIGAMYRSSVLNLDQAGPPILPDTAVPYDPDDYDYLIIYEDTYEEEITPFAIYKTSIGLQTEMAPLSEVGNTALEIKSYILQEYNDHDIQYVLFVGNDSDIPGYMGYNSFSDYYYTLLEGDDNFPDIALGRFSVFSEADVTNMVNKSIRYEYNPPAGDWRENALLVAHMQLAPLKYQRCKERIRTAEETPSGTYSVLYPNFTTAYGSSFANGGDEASDQDVIDYINAGMRVVNYRGHGSTTAWTGWNIYNDYFDTPDIAALDNGDFTPVVFSIACYNAQLDSPTMCLAENFTLHEDGAVACLGASRPSYTDANHTYDKKIFSAIFDEGINAIGYASNAAVIAILDQHGNYGLINARMYLWLGDPSLQVIYNEPPPVEETIWVDGSYGDDHTGDGSEDNPYASIGYAIDRASDGDTILVRPGIYEECLNYDGKALRIIGLYGPEFTFIEPGAANTPAVTMSSGEGPGCEFSGFTVRNFQASHIVVLRGASSPRIRNNIFVNNAQSPFQITRTDAVIEIRDSWPGIMHNLFYSNSHPSTIYLLTGSAKIINNTLDRNRGGITAMEPGIAINNNITNMTGFGFTGVWEMIEYNNVWHNNPDYLNMPTPIFDIHVNPVYIDPDEGRYHLEIGSSCIDAGNPNPGFNDPDGTRNDIGAYHAVYVTIFGIWSIQGAIDHSGGSDVIVYPGNYQENINYHGLSCRVIAHDNPDNTILRPANPGSPTITMSSGEDETTWFSGFTVTGSTSNVVVNMHNDCRAVIMNNVFTHNTGHIFVEPNYILTVRDGSPYITRNLIYNNREIGCAAVYNGRAEFYNNTFDDNYSGLYASHESIALNNIVTNSANYGFHGHWTLVDYNDVWHNNPNFTFVMIPIHNISADPLYNPDHSLDGHSPCINAGHPAHRFDDPDGTQNDMGAFPYSFGLFPKPETLPTAYSLSQNHPNPFNPTTTISFSLTQAGPVKLTVFNILGQQVTTIIDGNLEAGQHSVVWDGTDTHGTTVASGIYFYRLNAGAFCDSKKMVLLK